MVVEGFQGVGKGVLCQPSSAWREMDQDLGTGQKRMCIFSLNVSYRMMIPYLSITFADVHQYS